MARTWNCFLLLLLVGYVALGARGDAGLEPQETPVVDPNPALLKDLDNHKQQVENLKQQLQNLEDKKSLLESTIEGKDSELKNKDSVIAEKEKLIEEKFKTIASLQDEVTAIQKKGDLEAEATKAYERVHELEKQVEKLEHSLKQLKDKQQSFELRASEAENKAKEFSLKYEKLHKVVSEQKVRTQKAEQALQFAEKTMLKAQAEAKGKAEELKKVHGAWFPPWLAVHLAKLEASTKAYWANYGKPAMETVVEKASEKVAAAHDWAKPHLETAKTHMDKWSPVVKKQWEEVMVTVAPHMETLKTKAISGYEVSRDTISPHLAKAEESLRPHLKNVKDICGPYIDQAAAVAQPHVDKARVILQPYTDHAVHAYRRFLITATDYHYQLQGHVRKTLKNHEFTAALATKELVWFLASALLALPVLVLLTVYSSVLSNKKARKPARSNHTGNAHRKHKRRHADK